MVAFSFVFIPSMVAYQLSSNWRAALRVAAFIGGGCHLASFAAALNLDQPFGPVMVLVLLAVAGATSILQRTRAASARSSSSGASGADR